MAQINPRARHDRYGSRIGRAHSPFLAYVAPWLTVMIASLLPGLFQVGAVPIVPPLGFLVFMAWQIVRPGLLPIWSGFPLGLFNDLAGSDPIGSAIMLWSITMLVLEYFEIRFPWRSFVQDWITVAIVTATYLVMAALISGGQFNAHQLLALLPQWLFSLALFPLIARIASWVDRIRLIRFRKL